MHYAPSLVRRILSTPHQELATHTFSHYYCLEEGQTSENFSDDLSAAIQIASKYERRVVSIVFPRNQIWSDYLLVCRDLGIATYRGTAQASFYHPKSIRTDVGLRRVMRFLDCYLNISGYNIYPIPTHETGLLNLPASQFLRPYSRSLKFFQPLRLRRILSAMSMAARTGQVYHLWWHPHNFGVNLKENLAFLEKILVHFAKLRETCGMKSQSMSEIAWLVAGVSGG